MFALKNPMIELNMNRKNKCHCSKFDENEKNSICEFQNGGVNSFVSSTKLFLAFKKIFMLSLWCPGFTDGTDNFSSKFQTLFALHLRCVSCKLKEFPSTAVMRHRVIIAVKRRGGLRCL